MAHVLFKTITNSQKLVNVQSLKESSLRCVSFIPPPTPTYPNFQTCQFVNIQSKNNIESLPTLNNKKITAMFYVHLFLKAMYIKKSKLFFCCLHINLVTEAGSRLRRHGDVQVRTKRCNRESVRGGILTGIIPVITRTTAGPDLQAAERSENKIIYVRCSQITVR